MSEGVDESKAYAAIYLELKRIARYLLTNNQLQYTLGPTQLVHEAYLKQYKIKQLKSWEDRKHFFNHYFAVLRCIIVDYVRMKNAQKRTQKFPESDTDDDIEISDMETVLTVGDAIEKVRKIDEETADLLELRFFAGLSTYEIADNMGLCPRKVQRQLVKAKSVLKRIISD
ncbi:MAG: sigma-70 family RNA polymerase sigma factor [Aestuariibacter sp.]